MSAGGTIKHENIRVLAPKCGVSIPDVVVSPSNDASGSVKRLLIFRVEKCNE
jgi:hypothetical protein